MFQKQDTPTLRVADLFAGVGGFRLGLEAVHGSPFEFTLSNQFEPTQKSQHASSVYQAHWTTGIHLNEDIQEVLASGSGQQAIRDAAPDVVAAGFPCQDFSVARPLSQSKGLAGRKGTLWWSIAKLLHQRLEDGQPVKYLILENVDRILVSPSGARGRDFAVILATLRGLGYAAEWRVVNAANYGCAQKRKRIFIICYHQTTALYQRLRSTVDCGAGEHPLSQNLLATAFPCELRNSLDAIEPALTVLPEPLNEQLAYRPLSNGKSRFGNCGLMVDGQVRTCDADTAVIDDFTVFTGHRAPLSLGDIVGKTGLVESSFYIKPEDEDRWREAKGGKSVLRNKDGFEYRYSEGAMAFPDPLDRPARTIITSEGGSSPSRTKHAIREANGRLRRLTPEELEEINGFPRGFTDVPGVSPVARARLMGNSLVVPLVKRIGEILHAAHVKEN